MAESENQRSLREWVDPSTVGLAMAAGLFVALFLVIALAFGGGGGPTGGGG